MTAMPELWRHAPVWQQIIAGVVVGAIVAAAALGYEAWMRRHRKDTE